jgi:hypothetical protein
MCYYYYNERAAVTSTHALEEDIDGPRRGQRVVIYPKELTKLEQVLESRDPSIDTEDGHAAAYIAILQASKCFEIPPVFLKEDHPLITSDPQVSQLVPRWMNTAARVATGNRQRVLENDPDVMHSDDEDTLEDVKPDEELNMYTAGMDPSKGPIKLSNRQVAVQRAAAAIMAQQQALSIPQLQSNPASPAPLPPAMDEGKPVTRSRAVTDPTSQIPQPVPAATAPPRAPTPVIVPADPPSPKGKRSTLKAAASQKAPAGKPTEGAKAPKPVKGQESPETKVSKPRVDHSRMVTRAQEASRAGSLRSGGGSGQTDTCVAKGNPSKT